MPDMQEHDPVAGMAHAQILEREITDLESLVTLIAAATSMLDPLLEALSSASQTTMFTWPSCRRSQRRNGRYTPPSTLVGSRLVLQIEEIRQVRAPQYGATNVMRAARQSG
jgi:hypothetical protein